MRNSKIPQNNIDLFISQGRIPPQAVEIEESILGGMLQYQDFQLVGLTMLTADDFYKESSQIVFNSMKRLVDDNKPIDMLSVMEELRKQGEIELVGGAYYLAQLTMGTSSVVQNLEHHCRIVIEKRILRDIISASSEFQKLAYDDEIDALTLSEMFRVKTEEICGNINKGKETTLYQQQVNHSNALERRVKLRRENKLGGIRTPITDLTLVTRGWQDTDLIILAARPSMGKTAFAIECIIEACREGNHVVFFSLEMSEIQILDRIYMSVSGLSDNEIRNGEMSNYSYELYNKAVADVGTWNLTIDDRSGIDASYVNTKLKKLKQVGLVVIDYLQIMNLSIKSKSSSTADNIGETTRRLKGFAKEFSCPVMLLSQLNRKCEERSNKRPQQADLRDGGAIEADSDVIMFLYRDAAYEIYENESGESTIGVAELDVRKNRNGALKRIIMKHNETLTKFTDKDEFANETPVPPSHHHPDEYLDNPFEIPNSDAF